MRMRSMRRMRRMDGWGEVEMGEDGEGLGEGQVGRARAGGALEGLLRGVAAGGEGDAEGVADVRVDHPAGGLVGGGAHEGGGEDEAGVVVQAQRVGAGVGCRVGGIVAGVPFGREALKGFVKEARQSVRDGQGKTIQIFF